ncbi:hypothetical protein [Bradyrhizobium sp. CCBAU 25338]|jgi:hypothetical protein|uniref:hypothetical protein n=1 Tax=Bradyrhizobium sp. CCBAU 25338 TaxID=1641877 RepID=UPI0023025F0B|nr:hypothetical protein [Bradyrhizobium sp. CCBAU 25338]
MNLGTQRGDQLLSGFYSHPPGAGRTPPALYFKRAAFLCAVASRRMRRLEAESGFHAAFEERRWEIGFKLNHLFGFLGCYR